MSRTLNISLIQLEYLIALDEHRHFIKAAEACFVTQPTLSMQIKKLEDELGVKLFDRSRQPVIPTDVGSLVIEQARKVLRETQKIDNVLQEYKGTVSGDLVIGIIPTVSPYLMPHLISRISKDFPDIRLHVKELMTEEIVRMLREDHLDVGILATPLNEDGIIEKPVFNEKFCLYLNPEHPAFEKDHPDVNDLISNKLWLLSEGNCFRYQTINLCSVKDNRGNGHFDYESGSIETLIRIVNLEGGATVIPEWASLELPDEQKKNLRMLNNEADLREVSLVYTRNFAKAKLLDSLFEVLIKCVPENLKSNSEGRILKVTTR
ncbi:MAG: LysR family transcriptional regulator [Bacteroidetes bacterium]|nr:LysR family transcriptional regulator [Bacteroidota bacterium]